MTALTVAGGAGTAPADLRRRPVPVREPRAAVRVTACAQPPGPSQGVLVLDVAPPVGAPAPAPGAVRGAVPSAAPGVTTTDSGLPDPAGWAGQFVQAAVEVAAGLRQPSQLTRWTTGAVRDALARRGALNRRGPSTAGPGAARPAAVGAAPRRAVVRSVRASSPAPGVAEASAVVADGTRLRAVALRLEAFEGRWRVTALQIG